MMNKHLSKIEIAERLLTRPEGATMDEILAATGGSYQYNAKRRLEARGYTVKTLQEGRLLRYFAQPPAAPVFEVAVTSKGQVTIPKDIRKRLGVHAGGRLRLALEADDRVVMTPADLSVQRLFGILGKPPRRVKLEDIDNIIEQAVAEKYR